MQDRERVLSKIGELKGYITELKAILPKKFSVYSESITERRACERLLQISIECVLDICDVIFSELNLGVPSSEEDIIEKLEKVRVLTKRSSNKLKEMEKTRNVLVHRYPYLDDKKIFDILNKELGDFDTFIKEIVEFIKKNKTVSK